MSKKPQSKKSAVKPRRPSKPAAAKKGASTRTGSAGAKRAPVASSAAAAKTKAKTPAKTPAKTVGKVMVSGNKASEKKVAKSAKQARASSIVLPPNYRPGEDEPFMNERHRIYFRQKLLAWKEDIIRQTKETLAGLHEDSTQHADIADRATSETDRALELRARDRQRKLIAKIDAALARIEDGTYGYCEETGEPIGLKRLDARPIATLSLEAQERHERRERVYRED